jgi:hypothetical protein
VIVDRRVCETVDGLAVAVRPTARSDDAIKRAGGPRLTRWHARGPDGGV